MAIAAITALVVSVACGGRSLESTPPEIAGGEAAGACHMVSHAAGKTCVPDNPQRIVDLAGLDYALSLGVKPIASDSAAQANFYLRGEIDDIENVGGYDAPNLERIVELKPDLIVIGSYANVDYKLLSNIAPTVVIPYDYSGQWKDVFMQYAAALRLTEKAEQVMEHYYDRTQEFQQHMGTRAAETEISIVRVYPTQINLYLKDSFPGTVIADAGLSRPASQDFTASEAKNLFDNQIQYTISRENIPDVDGDALFLWTFGHRDEIAQNAQSEKEALKADPLWSTLSVVQQDRVYEVPGEYWIGDGPIAANLVIDDLFKYLLEEN
ncbi:iron-siderophore ABC transporter substrate-binding protein [Romeria aff. gracilis LEGE 07310]|uniref:Iron-siderophore ABC transporter substrate-binding protein n=1 Tax=Vasconcelosia minhoensis LEGE 07310 TaxID=915328 RepID=A0A8J7AT01_9CYAN|nr:iron-siderophore ABC transporter substrate-binding protein [Romeria gracilis]MBE9075843.1 iron-siderophore ABC transporter substrate-binding protein [Romeria aff. gracilis LEGE 07310]